MALTGLAIAAAIGLAKDQFIDKPADKKKRKLAAETERNSPWTGQHAGPVNDSNTVGTMMNYGVTGAQIGAGAEEADANKNAMDAYTNRMNTGGNPEGGGKNLYNYTPGGGGSQMKPNARYSVANNSYDQNQDPSAFWGLKSGW